MRKGKESCLEKTLDIIPPSRTPPVKHTFTDTLTDTFLADAASRCAEPNEETILFALAAGADRPSRFVRIVASTTPFASGDPLPKEAGR